jgi:hypothetical protein
VGPRAGLDAVARRKYPIPCRESNLGRPARSLVTMLTEIHWVDSIICTVHQILLGSSYQRGCDESGQTLRPTHPPIQLVLGVGRSAHECDYSLPISAEVKNAWNYTSTSSYVFMK